MTQQLTSHPIQYSANVEINLPIQPLFISLEHDRMMRYHDDSIKPGHLREQAGLIVDIRSSAKAKKITLPLRTIRGVQWRASWLLHV